MRLSPVWIAWLMIIAAASAASADYYYYSVAEDDFLDDNDTLWAALEPYPQWDVSRALLHDDYDLNDGVRTDGRDSLYDDLEWYADNLSSGDVFMLSYWGHGGWGSVDVGEHDEGSTPQPTSNDPDPDQPGPYRYDEFWSQGGGSSYLFDDDLTDAIADFDAGVEVVIISGACHSGGFVGGDHDLQTSAPATNNGLYAILDVPEQATGIGLKGSGDDYYEILLCTALSNAAVNTDWGMTMSEWYDIAMEWGETATSYVQMGWDSSPQYYKYWPDENWVPTAEEATYASGHWGWQEEYLQLRPEEYSWLDAAHDYDMTPEPATAGMVLAGLAAIGALRRRRS